MATEEPLGVFSTADARFVLETCRRIAALPLIGTSDAAPVFDSPGQIVSNVSGATIPAFGLVQLVDADAVGDRPINDGDAPADLFGLAGPYAAIGPRDLGDTDRWPLQRGPVLRILTDGADAITPGTRWAPTIGSHELQLDPFGQFLAIGEDPNNADVAFVYDLGSPELWRDAVPDANVSSGATGTFSIWLNGSDTGDNVTADYKWATDGETLTAGTQGFIKFCRATETWRWMGGACAPP